MKNKTLYQDTWALAVAFIVVATVVPEEVLASTFNQTSNYRPMFVDGLGWLVNLVTGPLAVILLTGAAAYACWGLTCGRVQVSSTMIVGLIIAAGFIFGAQPLLEGVYETRGMLLPKSVENVGGDHE